jgi:hypothetical protein
MLDCAREELADARLEATLFWSSCEASVSPGGDLGSSRRGCASVAAASVDILSLSMAPF